MRLALLDLIEVCGRLCSGHLVLEKVPDAVVDSEVNRPVLVGVFYQRVRSQEEEGLHCSSIVEGCANVERGAPSEVSEVYYRG